MKATAPNSPEKTYESWEPILITANYEFVYFDGLNRFYIAKEHSELVEAFSCPPNFFDHIQITKNSYLISTLLESYETRKQQLLFNIQCLQSELKVTNVKHEKAMEVRITELEKANAKLSELSHTSQYWQTVSQERSLELQNIYTSKSWQVTSPLRKFLWISKRIFVRLAHILSRIQKPIQNNSNTVSELEATTLPIEQPNESTYLSAHAACIYAELKKHIKQGKIDAYCN